MIDFRNYELVNFVSAYKVALSIVDCFEVYKTQAR